MSKVLKQVIARLKSIETANADVATAIAYLSTTFGIKVTAAQIIRNTSHGLDFALPKTQDRIALVKLISAKLNMKVSSYRDHNGYQHVWNLSSTRRISVYQRFGEPVVIGFIQVQPLGS